MNAGTVEIKDGRISNEIWRQLTVDEYWLVLGKKATAFLSFCLVLFGATGCLFLGCCICVLFGNGNALELDQETGARIYIFPGATATLLSQLNAIGVPRF